MEWKESIGLNWLVLLPALLSAIYFLVVKYAPLKIALTKTKQVNAVGLGLVLGLFVLGKISDFESSYFLYALLALGLINFLDDLLDVHFAWRLIVQFLGCSFLLMEHQLFYSYWSPILLLLSVGFLNAFNFMDGINGYVGTYSLSLLIPLLIFSVIGSEIQIISISTVIFLFFFLALNFRTKALGWLGDTGSVALGFIVLHVVFSNFKNYDLYLFLVLASFFLLDAGYTLLRRQFNGENVFERHHQHLYQVVNKSGRLKSYLFIFGIFFLQLSLNFAVLSVSNFTNRLLASILAALIISALYFYLRFKFSNSNHRV